MSRRAVVWVAIALLIATVYLQMKLWTASGGLADSQRLRERVEQQRQENVELRKRNEALTADVDDLKHGREAVEERARSELGMIKPGETFYQVVEPAKAQDH